MAENEKKDNTKEKQELERRLHSSLSNLEACQLEVTHLQEQFYQSSVKALKLDRQLSRLNALERGEDPVLEYNEDSDEERQQHNPSRSGVGGFWW